MHLKMLNKITDYLWEIPQSYRSDMRVPARVYASQEMLKEISEDKSLEQLINVSTLPGIQKYALAMPDIHEGYGFPIGGVAAFELKEGIISPGGIGYDINCGVRLLSTDLRAEDVKPHLENLARTLFAEIPSGVGRGGRMKLPDKDLDKVLAQGAEPLVKSGYGTPDDLEHIESRGYLDTADPGAVSAHAKGRGRDQLGTLGAGNHFVEVELIDEIFDEPWAQKFNLVKNKIAVLIHTGSRGLGHQIATDYIRLMMSSLSKYKIKLADRELVYAPFNSPEGQKYWSAMSAGANFAWANRQLITWEVREAWGKVFGQSGGELNIVYDVAHNIAKLEEYEIGGEKKKVILHRKGATRAFPGQPALIPGSMGTASYLLIGQEKSLTESFGSICHGAGRRMSRSQAKREIQADELRQRLKDKGILVNVGSRAGLTEEAPEAYKDVDQVVEVIHQSGIAKKIVRLKPLAVIKG